MFNPPDSVVNRFTRGGCHLFAFDLSLRLDGFHWLAVLPGYGCHAVVLSPCKTYAYDINGIDLTSNVELEWKEPGRNNDLEIFTNDAPGRDQFLSRTCMFLEDINLDMDDEVHYWSSTLASKVIELDKWREVTV